MSMFSLYGNEKKDSLEGLYPEETLKHIGLLISGIPFLVLNASLWHCHEPWEVSERQIGDNLFFFAVEGSYKVNIGGQKSVISRGEYAVITENTSHSYRFHEGCTSGSNIILHLLPLHPTSRNIFKGFDSPFQKLPYPEAVLDMLYRGIAMRNYDRNIAFNYIGEIVRNILSDALISDHYNNNELSSLSIRIKKACEFIHNNFSADFSVVDVAEHVNLKEVRFRRVFHSETGLSPNSYIQRVRLMYSVYMLMRYNYKLNKVAVESGFNSTSYFCSSFRNYFKMTPEDYRKKYHL